MGAFQSELAQSTVRASLVVGELRSLRTGQIDSLIRLKELELDSQVSRYQQFLDYGHPWLLWPTSRHFEHDRYLGTVAHYRQQHPPVMPSITVSETDPFAGEINANNASIARTTEEIVRRYAH